MPARIVLKTITEAEFLKQVAEFAKLHRWRVAHFRPARTNKGWRTPCQFDAAGFPDLILIRDGVLVIAELKVGRNKTTTEQEEWLWEFNKAAIEVYVWTPNDWDQIKKVLEL